jgi:hypothetical protein
MLTMTVDRPQRLGIDSGDQISSAAGSAADKRPLISRPFPIRDWHSSRAASRQSGNAFGANSSLHASFVVFPDRLESAHECRELRRPSDGIEALVARECGVNG